MSRIFPDWESLAASVECDGVSWDVLERRCLPGRGYGQTHTGWISDGMPLTDVLRHDWEVVASLGTTHTEVVAHLDAIWEKADPCRKDSSNFQYDVNSLLGNTLQGDPVTLVVSCLHTNGYQEDLLFPLEEEREWHGEWFIDANANHLLPGSAGRDKPVLRIGGRNSEFGVLRYTKDFGFYEGGAKNPYRIDPQTIVWALTGRRPQMSHVNEMV